MSGEDVKATLTLRQVDAINLKMDGLITLISVMVAASEGNSEYDQPGFAYLMEDKFAELFDTYKEATGQERRYQRFSSK